MGLMLSNQLPMLLMPFGDLLRSLRSSSGKSLGDTAKALGISVSDLSGIEMGEVPPLSHQQIATAAVFLGLSAIERLALCRVAVPATQPTIRETVMRQADVMAALAEFEAKEPK